MGERQRRAYGGQCRDHMRVQCTNESRQMAAMVVQWVWRSIAVVIRVMRKLMLVLMMAEVLRGRVFFVLAEIGHARPGHLDWQQQHQKSEE